MEISKKAYEPPYKYDLNSIFFEEIIHAFQEMVHGSDIYANIPESNKEFEAKLLLDIINRLNNDKVLGIKNHVFEEYSNKYYNKWTNKITNGYLDIPDWSIIQPRYMEMLNKFRTETINPSYAIQGNNTIPKALNTLLEKAKQQNCH